MYIYICIFNYIYISLSIYEMNPYQSRSYHDNGTHGTHWACGMFRRVSSCFAVPPSVLQSLFNRCGSALLALFFAHLQLLATLPQILPWEQTVSGWYYKKHWYFIMGYHHNQWHIRSVYSLILVSDMIKHLLNKYLLWNWWTLKGSWRVIPTHHPSRPYLGTGRVGYSKIKTPSVDHRFGPFWDVEYRSSNRTKSIQFFGGLTHTCLCLFGKLFFPFLSFLLTLLQVFLASG